MSERRACRLIGIGRSVKRYKRAEDRNQDLRKQLRKVALEKPKYGYRMLGDLMRTRGTMSNHKRIYRLYREENLALRRKKRSKRIVRERQQMPVPQEPNRHWAMDFIHDSLWNGRRFRCLTIVDLCSRYVPAIEVGFSLPAARVIATLDRLAFLRGLPEVITVDNGPEFVCRAMAQWAEANGVTLDFIEPGKPMQNGFIESLNRTFRHECLDANSFRSILGARTEIERWRNEYNTERPHSAIERRTPEAMEIDFYQKIGRRTGTNF